MSHLPRSKSNDGTSPVAGRHAKSTAQASACNGTAHSPCALCSRHVFKQAFANQFVQRSRFTSAYATSMIPAQFVDALFRNAVVVPSTHDRDAAINEFGAASTTDDVVARARALRRVAENPVLAQQEFNRAFVLMQYFGYLRRNPNDPQETTLDFQGYSFWLTKLNQFNGDFQNAEMVKAFLASTEYRQRFGQP